MQEVLRRVNGQLSAVTRAWEGETVVCIASGPSLTAEQVELARGRAKVIVVNDNYLIAPWADLLYFADLKWYDWHLQGLPKSWPWASFSAEQVRASFAGFAGAKVSIGDISSKMSNSVFVLKNYGVEGLSEDPSGLRTGMNSGYQAVNIAVLAGAKRVLLLGYDMKFSGNRSHSHNGHPVQMPAEAYLKYGLRFSSMLPQLNKLGVEVINCSPDSSIGCFKREDVGKALSCCFHGK